MKAKVAIVTGATGQDGAYLVKLLLGKGYIVHAAHRRTSKTDFYCLNFLNVRNHKNLKYISFDLLDMGSIIEMIKSVRPDELYNLAAQSFVSTSFQQPYLTFQTTGTGVLNILEAIRITKPDIRFYQASSSEMFGKATQTPQNEDTDFYPRSPYGVAKLAAYWMTINYRESYDIFASNGILFNHESPLRGHEFVTRKISDAVARIKLGQLDYFELGNLDAKRDWGFAGEYVEGMWRMLQQDTSDSFVLASGQTETVRAFVRKAFEALDFNITFEGTGLDEKVVDVGSRKTLVKISAEFFRPAEVELMVGDCSRAKQILGWEAKVGLDELCKMMVEADFKRLSAS